MEKSNLHSGRAEGLPHLPRTQAGHTSEPRVTPPHQQAAPPNLQHPYHREDVSHSGPAEHPLGMVPGNLCFNKSSRRVDCSCLRTTTLSTCSLSRQLSKTRAGKIPSARSFGGVEGRGWLKRMVLDCYPSSRKMQKQHTQCPLSL